LTLAKVFYVYQIIYSLTVFTVKTAVLLLYRRLFPTPRFKIAVHAMLAFNLACFISFESVVVFQCKRISDAWQNPMSGRCINQIAFFQTVAIFSIVTDSLILIMPLFVVWKLHANRKKKIALSGMFLLGSLSVAFPVNKSYSGAVQC
jgi:hypothetical protein